MAFPSNPAATMIVRFHRTRSRIHSNRSPNPSSDRVTEIQEYSIRAPGIVAQVPLLSPFQIHEIRKNVWNAIAFEIHAGKYVTEQYAKFRKGSFRIMAKTAAIIGAGLIGAGWAARFILAGWNVKVFDPSPTTRATVNKTLNNATISYCALFDFPLPKKGEATFPASVDEAVEGVDWIQESVPERLETKLNAFQKIQRRSAPGITIASSTSGFKPSVLQENSPRPDEIMVAHAFNPVYLLPLVELVCSQATSPSRMDNAMSTMRELGMKPIRIEKEIDAHIGDRLLEAVWRESLWLVNDGIATTEEIDDVVRFSFGLRWAQMGVFENYRIGGGDAGMEHFLAQFGPCLKLPWTRLMDTPEYSRDLIRRITDQSDEQSGSHSIQELERHRDANLVAILRGLKSRNWGAGNFLAELEKSITLRPGTALENPIHTLERIIPPGWSDYNGHMNEARYLDLFSNATDRFLELIGCDEDYVRSGKSFFTLETNICHFAEVREGDRVRMETCCLFAEGKKLHLIHLLLSGGRQVATGEHLLVHVDLNSRKSCLPSSEVSSAATRIAINHSGNSSPDWAISKLSFQKTRA